MSGINISQLNSEIQRIMREYEDDVEEDVSKAVDKCAKEAKKIIVDHAPSRHGDYKKNISTRKERTRKGQYKKVVFVKAPYYRIAHLLEYSHATRNGGSTTAQPHFRFGEEYLDKNFEREVRERIEQK